MSIPKLTEIQKKYADRGVVIIGLSSETAEVVAPFVAEMGSKMDYAVALDDGRKTRRGYMRAYEENGIPISFVVNRAGTMVWFGRGENDLDEVLGELIDGSFDLVSRKKARSAGKDVERYKNIALFGNHAELRELGESILLNGGGDTRILNDLAWFILTNSLIANRDLELALRIANAAYEGSGKQNPAIMDTYARALFMLGRVEEAIAVQQAAVTLTPDGKLRVLLVSSLREYFRAALK